MITRTQRRTIAFISLSILGAIVTIWYLLGEQTIFDAQSKLHFLQQPKEIAQRDFSFIEQYFAPQQPEEVAPSPSPPINPTINPTQNEPHTPPQLFAIMDNRAFIDTQWRNLYEVFTHGGMTYRVRSIAKNHIMLQQDDGTMLLLEISATPKELILQVR